MLGEALASFKDEIMLELLDVVRRLRNGCGILLRALAVEYPRSHDVGNVLIEM